MTSLSSQGASASTIYPLTGMHCGACVQRISEALRPHAGAVEVSLRPMQVTLAAPAASFATLREAVQAAGNYDLLPAQVVAGMPLPGAASPVDALPPTSWKTYQPLLLILAYLLGGTLILQLRPAAHGASWQGGMMDFMAGFFLVFSFFKLLDLHAFAQAYRGYDVLAQAWRGWAWVYPFVELALGAAYLARWQPQLTGIVTIVVMGVSLVGVVRALLGGQQIRCACLGTVFKLPMSTVTLVEDGLMLLMAAAMVWAGR